MDIEFKKFVLKVEEMRKFQKAFFEARTPGDLRRAKDLERETDKLVASLLNNQVSMF